MRNRFLSAWRPVSRRELTPLQGTRNTLHLSSLLNLCALKRLIHVNRLSPGRSKSALPSEEGVNLFPGLTRELDMR